MLQLGLLLPATEALSIGVCLCARCATRHTCMHGWCGRKPSCHLYACVLQSMIPHGCVRPSVHPSERGFAVTMVHLAGLVDNLQPHGTGDVFLTAQKALKQ